MLPHSLLHLLTHRRVLLLQGPMGPFFAQLGQVLRARGAAVWKVNFNAGDDWFDTGPDVLPYRGTPQDWPAQCAAWLDQHRIDALVLFGQMRPLHLAAIAQARRLGVTVFVFEEGYLRPDWVTLEEGGVNAHSATPRDAAFYRALPASETPEPQPTRQRFVTTALLAMRYGWQMWAGRARYPHYVHHRCLHPWWESVRWWRGAARQQWARWVERGEARRLAAPSRQQRYFLVPLQVSSDAQVIHHSPCASVQAFIAQVVASFAAHADAGDWLVFKHHPLDLPYSDHRALLRHLAREHGLGERVRYVHELHLPTALRHARGVVTINSTVGLQALYHGTPVHTVGDSVYDVEGLVHGGTLEAFWKQPGSVDMALLHAYRAHVIAHTQINASFYADAPALDSLRATPGVGNAAAFSG